MQTKKVFYYSIFILALLGLSIFVYNRNIQHKQQEQKKLDQSFSEISQCTDNDCYEEFFENYTKNNGTVPAIDYFKTLVAQHPDYISNCHYMFHGIGHGTYDLSGGNIEKAFSLGNVTEMLMNIPTCGNGYYHGVIGAYVGEENTDEQTLVKSLTQVCKNISDSQVIIDCYHGLGHAILVHLDGQVDKAVKLCDQISPNEKMQTMCHTGVFMEMVRNENYDNKVLTFSKCENLPTDMQKAECFNQHSYLLNDFLDNKDAFIKNMLECEAKVKDMEERIICIRKEKL